MSGIGLAAQLKRNYKSATFEIYEKTNDIGGTWAVNTYPGCGVDVPSHFYSYSFALNPNWTRKFPMQQEILAYFHTVAKMYGLGSHTRLQCTVQSVVWDDALNVWNVTIFDQASKSTFQRSCKALVSAVGALSTPKDCDISGKEKFQGSIFHSARWNHSFDHADKNILVLGKQDDNTPRGEVLNTYRKRMQCHAVRPRYCRNGKERNTGCSPTTLASRAAKSNVF